jgi:hypothetical protein
MHCAPGSGDAANEGWQGCGSQLGLGRQHAFLPHYTTKMQEGKDRAASLPRLLQARIHDYLVSFQCH